MFDTTLGWRFENAKLAARVPLESMGETAENVAEKWKIAREEQDAFALESQKKAGARRGDASRRRSSPSRSRKEGRSGRRSRRRDARVRRHRWRASPSSAAFKKGAP
jgi:hypothetical protein